MSKTLAFCLGAAALSIGCAGKPAAPFDTLKTSNLTAFRLQNNEPPSVLPTATPSATGTSTIPGLDPSLQNSITAGVQALQKLIPPGLQIPGLQIPGVTGATSTGTTPLTDTTPRFQNYRIIAQQQVLDADLKESLGKLLGDKDNFDNQFARCPSSGFFPEFGLSFSSAAGAQANDLLVSLACNQIVSRTFSWPYPATGMKIDTHADLNEILVKIFPQGT